MSPAGRGAWPRGRYNGQRIEGLKLSLTLHVLDWRAFPLLRWNRGEPFLIWLCLTVRGACRYEP